MVPTTAVADPDALIPAGSVVGVAVSRTGTAGIDTSMGAVTGVTSSTVAGVVRVRLNDTGAGTSISGTDGIPGTAAGTDSTSTEGRVHGKRAVCASNEAQDDDSMEENLLDM